MFAAERTVVYGAIFGTCPCAEINSLAKRERGRL